MDEQIQIISGSEAIFAADKAQIDVQIATAHAYPRDIQAAINQIKTIATCDVETAEECFYFLRRDGKVLEGPSVRMAEIVASAWGNLRTATRIVANDGKTITAQGMCHDLESNNAVIVEVKRRITNKEGRTFSDDMQIVTGNAAGAIALRNAVFKVVPKAVVKKVLDEIKAVAVGKAMDMEQRRQNSIANFAKIGVTEDMICTYFDVRKVEELDNEMLFQLKGTWQAIKEGRTTVNEVFVDPVNEKRKAQEAREKTEQAKSRAARAAERQNLAKTQKSKEQEADTDIPADLFPGGNQNESQADQQ